MDAIKSSLDTVRLGINGHFVSKEPWQIVTVTASSVLLSVWIYEFIFQEESVADRAKRVFFKIVKLIPRIRNEIDTRMAEVSATLENDMKQRTQHLEYIMDLPSKGLNKEEILKIIDENLSYELGASEMLSHIVSSLPGGSNTIEADYNWNKGYVSGAVYYSKAEQIDLITAVYAKTSYTNPLHPDIFPGLCKMEAEVIRIASVLFHGDENTCGTMTTGGTESILMAVKAYRDYAREEKGIRNPEMVIPVTAHAAFHKAALYFKIRIRYIALDPNTFQVDLKAMKRSITSNTIMLVGSAPNFPYGTMDDIPAIAEMGLRYNIPVHVDSCLGGFLTTFMSDAGYPILTCDFRLPGVTSISADTHKYGFTPKGSSVILYKDKKYLHHQYTVTTDWPGGVYGSPTISGSRAGGAIATCWATLLSFGKEGYIQATREIIHTARYIEKGLRGIKGIYIFGQPATSVIAIGSKDFEIFRLSSVLMEKGWSLNTLQYPSGLHFCVTHVHTKSGVADRFIIDVKEAVEELMKDPSLPVEGRLALYGTAQDIPDRSIVGDFTRCFLDAMYYLPKPST